MLDISDMTSSFNFAVLTSSDSGARGERQDIGGDAVAEVMVDAGHVLADRKMLPDDRGLIANQLSAWCKSAVIDVILTTGGTGLGARDVMPEAMLDVIDYEVPGISEAMRAASLQITAMAMLSRAKAGVCNGTLIVNLPGSPKGAVESLEAIKVVLPHAVEILRGTHSGAHPVKG